MDTLVSLIITTKNEEKSLRTLLISIQKQTYKNQEIILVDNNSTDGTKEIARKARIRIFNCGPERSLQRNMGARKAKNRYLLFLDADMRLTKGVVEECVDLVVRDKSLGGIVIPESSIATNFWEKVKAFERSFYNEKGDIISDAARFFPKKVFDKIGGYDEAITGPEDWDITDRIYSSGYIVGRAKSKIYHYEQINSLFMLMKKKFYYGLDAHKYIRKHKISVLGPKTVYFLRPVFFKNFDKIFSHPLLSLGMFVMLFSELLAGGLGYLTGRIRKL